MSYISFFTSADGPGDDATWSVYQEEYTDHEAEEPIDRSQTLIESGLPREVANARSSELFRQARSLDS